MLTNNGRLIKKICAFPTLSYYTIIQRLFEPIPNIKNVFGNQIESAYIMNLFNARESIVQYDSGENILYSDPNQCQFTTDKEFQSWSNSFHGGLTILCGSGNTPENVEDYKLNDCIQFEGLNSNRTLYIKKDSNDSNNILLCRQFVNNTGTEQIIREIGLYTHASSSNQQVTNNNRAVLLARKVLENPIVVPVGNIPFTVYYSLKNDIE